MITVVLHILYFLLCVFVSIVIHELGHLLVALWCKVPVEVFSIGFGKAIIKKKKWGIEWRLSMIPLGGYTSLTGETDYNNKTGFLAQRYSKKVAILVAGVAMNFLLACICYLILYKSITKGIIIDFTIIKVFFTKDYATLIYLMEHVNFNHMLLQLSIINIFCCLNLLPIYPMDGGIIVWGRIIEKNFHKYADLIQRISMIILWVLQIVLLFYVWFL